MRDQFRIDSSTYRGTRMDGVPHGSGQVKLLNSGFSYIGEIEYGYLHGTGTLYKDNKTYFEGGFFENKLHGFGTQYHFDGSIRYQGLWEYDFWGGSGIYFPIGTRLILESECWQPGGLANGACKISSRRIDGKNVPREADRRKMFVGECKDGLIHGEAVFYHDSNGAVQFEGKYDEGIEIEGNYYNVHGLKLDNLKNQRNTSADNRLRFREIYLPKEDNSSGGAGFGSMRTGFKGFTQRGRAKFVR